MPIDFTRPILNMDDEPMPDEIAMLSNGERRIDLTLGRAAAHALSASFDDEKHLPGDQKFERGMLAVKYRDDSAATPKAEHIVLIKKLISKLYGPLVVYRAFPMLDPQEEDET